MRIVYVLTSLGIGGAERQTLAIADGMAARGHSVAILVLRPAVAEQWPTKLQVVHLDIRKTCGSVVAGILRAGNFLRGYRPDLVHSHSFHANIVARLLGLFVPSVQVVSTIHNVYEGRWYRMWAYRLTDSLACFTTAVSQAAADRFVRLKAIDPRKCLVILNGIDIASFEPNEARRNRVREQMGAADHFIWLAAGRHVPAKDFPNLLRAFQLVHETFPQAQLWIAGALADVSMKPYPDVASRSVSGFDTDPGTMGQVHLLGLRRDMPALLNAADGFVQSSAWEGMPLIVGEAMAMEKSVVATDAGGTREIVGERGVMVPIKDSVALATAMLELMRRTEESRLALGRAARTRIVQQFGMDARADEWEALYRSIVEARF
jgi:glycosyltransferase involved in cell wall biosynthesis